MKKTVIVAGIVCMWMIHLAFTNDTLQPQAIPPFPQQAGDAAKGYQYLITGDYLKSGIPYDLFMKVIGKDTANYLKRDGKNAELSFEYTAITAPNGELIASMNCLQCHAQVIDNKLYVGLGNTMLDFTKQQALSPAYAGMLYKMLSIGGSRKFEASQSFLRAVKTVGPSLYTEVRGVNVASKLTAMLVAHRDPVTFKWHDKASIDIPEEVIPSDVPAWWLLKKKNAMFYNGFGRGDFSKFLMASNLLTVSDTLESAEVYKKFPDVLAYIKSIEAPKYPNKIDAQLAAGGEKLFNENCSHCHGTYDANGEYPNLLIPAEIIGTDTALFASNYSYPQFIEWFNKSWFTMGDHPAQLVPYKGYIAPPLDGVWITAPYLHNGSVPTLEGVLNSKARPQYWSRDFKKEVYDYDSPGWKYTKLPDASSKNVYNTTLKGYSNAGHYFGDKLTATERKAVIEYLKTL